MHLLLRVHWHHYKFVCWLSHWNGVVRKNKTAESRRVTGFAARRQTMEPLEFSKTGKKRRLKRQIFCFCGVRVVSSTVFEREISCQHVDVNMRMLRFFSVEKPGIIWHYSQVGSISFWSGLSHLSLLYVWYSTTIGRWTAQVTSMRGTCGTTKDGHGGPVSIGPCEGIMYTHSLGQVRPRERRRKII